jgi:hypothetical protein
MPLSQKMHQNELQGNEPKDCDENVQHERR